MFISPAFAQEAAATAPEAFSLTSLVPVIAMFAIFYFLMIRPHNKKMKEHQELVNNLKTGNKVVTNGGIIGVVKDVFPKENLVEIEIAENVRVKILKNYVSDLVTDENKKTK